MKFAGSLLFLGCCIANWGLCAPALDRCASAYSSPGDALHRANCFLSAINTRPNHYITSLIGYAAALAELSNYNAEALTRLQQVDLAMLPTQHTRAEIAFWRGAFAYHRAQYRESVMYLKISFALAEQDKRRRALGLLVRASIRGADKAEALAFFDLLVRDYPESFETQQSAEFLWEEGMREGIVAIRKKHEARATNGTTNISK